MKIISLPSFLIILLLLNCNLPDIPDLAIEKSMVEYLENPLGIDVVKPRFTWSFTASTRNQFQSHYRILLTSMEESLEQDEGDVWDTGKVESDQSLNIVYDGPPLESTKRYYWKVKAWNQHGYETGWSETSWFEMGMISQNDWKGKWIGDGKLVPERDEDFYNETPSPLFRKGFSIKKPVKYARLYISGLGYYEAYINGKKIGDHVLDPGWTNYGKRVLYETYDITEMLSEGNNALGVMLGNGWYNPLPLGLFRRFNLRKILTVGQPKLIAQLEITYEDGAKDIVITDRSWKSYDSHVLKNNIYLGELQDGRRKIREWAEADFNDAEWNPVVISSVPGGKLKAQMSPPIRITGRYTPVSLTEPVPGTYVYDLGKNFAGTINFKPEAIAGQRISFLFGEMLNENGTVNGMTTVAGHIKEIWNLSGGPGAPKTAFQIDEYIASGEEGEAFQPHFTFHGFRYVEIKGLQEKPALNDMEGLRLSASLETAGTFVCSNDLFNQTQEMVLQTFLSNVFSVQSDCPGREKFGYGADIVTSAEAFIYNYDMATFYIKNVNDFANDVRPNGGMPECAPHIGIDSKGFGEESGPIGWQLAYPFIQKKLYEFYGNKRILEENYELTKGMIEFLRTQAEDNLIYHGISDHVSVDPKPEALTSGAFYYHNVKLLAEIAEILGKSSDALEYNNLASTIRNSFNEHYLNTGTGKYDTLTTQITQVFGLFYDLVPEEEKEKAFNVLLDEIDKEDGHLTTGIFATKMLFDVLRLWDRNDVAFTINNQTTYPSYGFMLGNDATTLWENWDIPDQNSLNHPMFGSVSEWYYRSLVGINPADGSVGFNKVVIKPNIVGDLNQVSGSYRSIKGEIGCSWIKKNNAIEVNVKIPPNVLATIYIPASSIENIKEGGKKIHSKRDLKFIKMDGGYAIFETGSGQYSFSSELLF
ncbi:family 78 glycoside hydrolase catalytic domain [Bacteroidota bacterium]